MRKLQERILVRILRSIKSSHENYHYFIVFENEKYNHLSFEYQSDLELLFKEIEPKNYYNLQFDNKKLYIQLMKS